MNIQNPILIMTACSSVDSAVEALKAGAYDYLTKPLDFEVLKLSLARALEHTGLKAENVRLKSELSADYELENITRLCGGHAATISGTATLRSKAACHRRHHLFRDPRGDGLLFAGLLRLTDADGLPQSVRSGFSAPGKTACCRADHRNGGGCLVVGQAGRWIPSGVGDCRSPL